MESEVEPDSDHDDTDHDLSHGHWMGHPDDPNKVRSSCEVSRTFICFCYRQADSCKLFVIRKIIFVMIGLFKVKDNGFVIIMVDYC